MVRNTVPSRTSSTVRQFCESESRFCGESMRGAKTPVRSPATTAATSPEAPSSSAGTDATNGTAKEMTVFTVGSLTRLRTARLSEPAAQPSTAATATE